MLASTALVMLMTSGLGLFYEGMVRRKNVLSMISLCFLALAIVGIQWIVIGYTLSFGSDINGIIGSLEYLGMSKSKADRLRVCGVSTDVCGYNIGV